MAKKFNLRNRFAALLRLIAMKANKGAKEREQIASELNRKAFENKIRALGLELDSKGNIIPKKPTRELSPRQKIEIQRNFKIAGNLTREAQRRRRIAQKLKELSKKIYKRKTNS